MDLSKRLLLLRHINCFIREQYEVGLNTRDILGMLAYKSNHYRKKLSTENLSGVRKIYIENYSLYLQKRLIDFEYYRKKEYFKKYNDKELFKVIDFRDTILFKKIYKDQ